MNNDVGILQRVLGIDIVARAVSAVFTEYIHTAWFAFADDLYILDGQPGIRELHLTAGDEHGRIMTSGKPGACLKCAHKIPLLGLHVQALDMMSCMGRQDLL